MKNDTKKNNKKQEFLEKYSEKKVKIKLFLEFVKKYKSEAMNLRISDCASLIGFLKTENNQARLSGGNFCNSRFCPFCDMRKARKDGYILLFLLNYLNKIEKKELIFLTLTAPNVVKELLTKEIEDFNKSFKRLSETKSFKNICKGYIRKLEVTYNSKENTFHPHFHCVLAVNKSYFKKSELYISQKKWLEMWQKAKKDNSITQVDVRKAVMIDMKSIMELATYSAKASDVLYSQEIFDVFYQNLKSKKLIVFNGIFKDVLKKYKIGELQEFEETDENIYNKLEWYKYHKSKGYELFRIDEIDKKDLEKLKIDEIEID